MKHIKDMTLQELRKRRRSVVAYRNKCSKDPYMKSEAVSAQCDLYDINEKIGELEK
jgi:hypothetical protein